ncbi:MAG TPA: hypothetical protein PKZ76_01045 [Xanthomonadaceae bacterium]|nr:hypothetical protein [Xanthomonadaceae bacterium]
MKFPITPLTAGALLATLTLFSGLASAEAYDIRLQTRLALDAMAKEQRSALRHETECAIQAQSEALAAMAFPWQTEYLASIDRDIGGSAYGSAAPEPAAAPVQSQTPKRAPRTSKFGLPYFSFGKLLSGNKDS